MLPKFSNPHLRTRVSQIVSRHDLVAEETEERDEPLQDEETLAILENLVKRSLGELELQNGSEQLEERSQRKKKRRKLDADAEEAIEEDQTISFRLVSTSRNPILLSLKPKPPPVIKTREPACEDDEDEARIRAERAAAVAVDASEIILNAKVQLPNQARESPYVSVVTDAVFEGSAMCVLEQPRKPGAVVPLPKRPKLPEQTRPSPHELKLENLKVSTIACDSTSEPKKRKPRRRRMAEAKARPPPAFWRPMMEWGGKSAGYAYGFTSSRPIWTEETRWRPYRRDNMKKATFVM